MKNLNFFRTAPLIIVFLTNEYIFIFWLNIFTFNTLKYQNYFLNIFSLSKKKEINLLAMGIKDRIKEGMWPNTFGYFSSKANLRIYVFEEHVVNRAMKISDVMYTWGAR